MDWRARAVILTVVCETLRIYVQFLGMATQTTHRENPGRICKKHPKNLSVWLRDFLSKEAMYSYVVVQPRSWELNPAGSLPRLKRQKKKALFDGLTYRNLKPVVNQPADFKLGYSRVFLVDCQGAVGILIDAMGHPATEDTTLGSWCLWRSNLGTGRFGCSTRLLEMIRNWLTTGGDEGCTPPTASTHDCLIYITRFYGKLHRRHPNFLFLKWPCTWRSATRLLWKVAISWDLHSSSYRWEQWPPF